MYASFFALLFDFEAGHLCLAGAAHPPILELSLSPKIWRRRLSSATYLGIMDPMPLSCDSKSVALSSGQRFLLYSYGLIEAEGAGQELFGIESLSLAFAKSGGDEGQKLNTNIFDQVINFSEDGFNDDVLLISIVIKELITTAGGGDILCRTVQRSKSHYIAGQGYRALSKSKFLVENVLYPRM